MIVVEKAGAGEALCLLMNMTRKIAVFWSLTVKNKKMDSVRIK